jgi:hypothetical protein
MQPAVRRRSDDRAIECKAGRVRRGSSRHAITAIALDVLEKIASYLPWENRVEIACTCRQLGNVKTWCYIPPNSGASVEELLLSAEEGTQFLVAGDQEIERTLEIKDKGLCIKSAHLHLRASRKNQLSPGKSISSLPGIFRFKSEGNTDLNKGLLLRGSACRVSIEGLTIVNSEAKQACVTVSDSAFARIEHCELTSKGCGNGIIVNEAIQCSWLPKTRVEVRNNTISDHKFCGLYVNGKVRLACVDNTFKWCNTTAIHRCSCASVVNGLRHKNSFASNVRDLCLAHEGCEKRMSEPTDDDTSDDME